jgi:ribose transport system permease protein
MAASVTIEPAPSRPSFSGWLVARVDLALRLGLLLIIIVMGIFYTIRTIPSGNLSDIGQSIFFSIGNMQNIARQLAVIGIIAIGETLVIITAGIDLSVGAVLGLSAIIVGKSFYPGNLSVPEIAVIAIMFGMFVGGTTGFLVAWAKVPPFIVTLGMMGICRGIAYIASGSVDAPLAANGANTDFSTWAEDVTFGFPNLFLILVAIAVVAELFLRFTRRGRYLYAVGSNPEAARLSGVNIIGILVLVYAVSGLLAGVAGFLQAGRLNVANANFGLGNELDAIAAVVLGGASLFGAKGNIIGTALGLLLINEISNGNNLINADPNVQQSVEGALLILIVFIDQWRKRRLLSV